MMWKLWFALMRWVCRRYGHHWETTCTTLHYKDDGDVAGYVSQQCCTCRQLRTVWLHSNLTAKR